MLDLMNIARTEADGGNLQGLLESLFDATKCAPTVIRRLSFGRAATMTAKVNPVAHSLTDAYALLGTIAAIDILGLPYYAVDVVANPPRPEARAAQLVR